METALKALYWSTLVYRYEEKAPELAQDKPVKVKIRSACQTLCILKRLALLYPTLVVCSVG